MGHRRLGSHLTQAHINELVDALEKQSTFQHGRGVLLGCHLTPMEGLKVRCEAGIISVEAAKLVAWEDDIPLQANSETYVWRDETGRFQTTPTPEPIGGLFVCVGRVVTDARSVVLCDGKGRMEPARMDPDNPGSFVVRAEVLPKGASHLPVQEVFTDSDVPLTVLDRNVQVIDAGKAKVAVFLPDAPHWGNWFRIANDGQADLTVVANDDKVTTLVPGEMAEFVVQPASRKRGGKASTAQERKDLKYKARRGVWCVSWRVE